MTIIYNDGLQIEKRYRANLTVTTFVKHKKGKTGKTF